MASTSNGNVMSLPVIERVHPFHCGMQHADWEACNCDRCTKNTPHDQGMPTCEIQRAIFESMWTDGSVSADIGRRMGVEPGVFPLVWQCGEVEWTPEWIAESKRRRTLRYRFAKWRRESKRAVRNWFRTRYEALRTKWRMPIANRHADRPDTCSAEWISWAIGYGEKPGQSGAGSCRDESRTCGSCWCGKFNNGELSTANVVPAGRSGGR